MSVRRISTALGAVMTLTLVQGCEQPASPGFTPELKVALDPALCAPTREGFSLNSNNSYFPIGVGRRWFYEGVENGELITLEITVLDETETFRFLDENGDLFAEVTTRVIEEVETVAGQLRERSRNFFVQASDRTVCYFGEAVDIYENGTISSHEGAWRADEPGHRPGIIMPAVPRPGVKFQMEGAPGIAEDEGTIVGYGPVEVPVGLFPRTIRVREFNPLDGGKGYKVYAAGVGLLIDDVLELVSFVP